MSRGARRATWPALMLLVAMFVASLYAPRGWEQIGRDAPLGRLARVVRPRPTVDAKPAPPVERPALPEEPAPPREGPTLADPGPIAKTEVDTPLQVSVDLVPVAGPKLTEPKLIAPQPKVARRQEPPRDPRLVSLPEEAALDTDSPDRDVVTPIRPEAVRPVPPVLGPPPRTNRWPIPSQLLEQVAALEAHAETSSWASDVIRLVHELTADREPPSERTADLFLALRESTVAAEAGASSIGDERLASEWLRARHALLRRLDIWQWIPKLDEPATTDAVAASPDCRRLGECLTQVAMYTGSSEAGSAWRDYVMFDAVSALAAENRDASNAQSRNLARMVLERLEQARFHEAQRAFVSSGPFAALGSELRHWAAEPVEPWQVLENLEQYESSRYPHDARQLATEFRRLSWSPAAPTETMEAWFDANYRNANLRVAITAEMLNRLVPQPGTAAEAVNDCILGVPTHGRSNTATKLDVRLVPDPFRLRMSLEAMGDVSSLTQSTKGPATFHSKSTGTYSARKEIEFGPSGVVQTSPSSVDAHNNARLCRVETALDGIPLIGSLVEALARSGYENKRDAARRETERKISQRAATHINTAAETMVARANDQLHERLAVPLDRLSLESQVVEMQTTADEMHVRWRLAAQQQLAGNTPRPRAPEESLACFAIHESLLNNFFEQLGLADRTFTVPELTEYLSGVLNLPETIETEASAGDVLVRFAEQDSAFIRCDNGRIEINLAISQLEQGSRAWDDFSVRVFYRPDVQALDARLVRDGTVQLISGNSYSRAQIALRGIFSKLFSRDRALPVIHSAIAENPAVADLEVTQFVIDDGWIGVAVGPRKAEHEAGQVTLAR